MRNLFRKRPPYLTIPAQARAAPGPSNTDGTDGLWVRCENDRCRELLYVREFENNLKVCHKCEHHARLAARERIAQLVDEDSFEEHDAELAPDDPLEFVAAGESYRSKLDDTAEKTGEREAAISGSATLDSLPVELVVLDFAFMGASMGSVVGEKIARAADRAASTAVGAAHGQRLRRRPHARGHLLADADGQDGHRPQPARAGAHAPLLRPGRSDARRRHGQLCRGGRRHHRRTRRAGRLRRAARDRADHQAEAAARRATRGVLAGARHARPGRPASRAATDVGSAASVIRRHSASGARAARARRNGVAKSRS